MSVRSDYHGFKYNYSTRFPVCRFISKCNQLSHCSYDNSIICFQSVKIIYRHVIAIYRQDFLFFEDSPVVGFLFLPLFFAIFSLERLSLRTAGFSDDEEILALGDLQAPELLKVESYTFVVMLPRNVTMFHIFLLHKVNQIWLMQDYFNSLVVVCQKND